MPETMRESMLSAWYVTQRKNILWHKKGYLLKDGDKKILQRVQESLSPNAWYEQSLLLAYKC